MVIQGLPNLVGPLPGLSNVGATSSNRQQISVPTIPVQSASVTIGTTGPFSGDNQAIRDALSAASTRLAEASSIQERLQSLRADTDVASDVTEDALSNASPELRNALEDVSGLIGQDTIVDFAGGNSNELVFESEDTADELLQSREVSFGVQEFDQGAVRSVAQEISRASAATGGTTAEVETEEPANTTDEVDTGAATPAAARDAGTAEAEGDEAAAVNADAGPQRIPVSGDANILAPSAVSADVGARNLGTVLRDVQAAAEQFADVAANPEDSPSTAFNDLQRARDSFLDTADQLASGLERASPEEREALGAEIETTLQTVNAGLETATSTLATERNAAAETLGAAAETTANAAQQGLELTNLRPEEGPQFAEALGQALSVLGNGIGAGASPQVRDLLADETGDTPTPTTAETEESLAPTALQDAASNAVDEAESAVATPARPSLEDQERSRNIAAFQAFANSQNPQVGVALDINV